MSESGIGPLLPEVFVSPPGTPCDTETCSAMAIYRVVNVAETMCADVCQQCLGRLRGASSIAEDGDGGLRVTVPRVAVMLGGDDAETEEGDSEQ